MSLLIRIPGPFNSKYDKATGKRTGKTGSVTYDLPFKPAAVFVYVDKWKHSISDKRNISIDKITFGGEYFANVYNSRASKCCMLIPKWPKASENIKVEYSTYGPSEKSNYNDYALILIVLNKEEYDKQKLIKSNAYNNIVLNFNHAKLSNDVPNSMYYNAYFNDNSELVYNRVCMGTDKVENGGHLKDNKSITKGKPMGSKPRFDKDKKPFKNKNSNLKGKFDNRSASKFKPYFNNKD